MLSRILVRFPLKCHSNYGNATAIKRELIQFKIAALRQQVLHDPRNLHCIPAITTNGYTRQLLRERQFCGFIFMGIERVKYYIREFGASHVGSYDPFRLVFWEDAAQELIDYFEWRRPVTLF